MHLYNMRLAFLLLLSLFYDICCGQNQKAECILPYSCIEINNGKPMKPLVLNKEYQGTIIVRILIDSSKLVLKNYEFIYVNLTSRNNSKNKIEVTPETKIGNVTYLKKIEPFIKNYLEKLRITKIHSKDCQMSTYFSVGISIR